MSDLHHHELRGSAATNAEHTKHSLPQDRLIAEHLHSQAYFKPALMSPETRRRQMPEPIEAKPLPAGSPQSLISRHHDEEVARRKEIDRCLKVYSEKELDQVRRLVKNDLPAVAAADRQAQLHPVIEIFDPALGQRRTTKDLSVRTACTDALNSDLNSFDRVDSQSEKQRVLHLTNLFVGEQYLGINGGHLENTSASARNLSIEKELESRTRRDAIRRMLY